MAKRPNPNRPFSPNFSRPKKRRTSTESLNALERIHEKYQDLEYEYTKTGQQHDPNFICRVQFRDQVFEGVGPKKQAAKHEAGEKLWSYIQKQQAGPSQNGSAFGGNGITSHEKRVDVNIAMEHEPNKQTHNERFVCDTPKNGERVSGNTNDKPNFNSFHKCDSVYEMSFDFTITLKRNAPLYRRQMHTISSLLSALLNSQKGTVELKSRHHVPLKALDQWRNNISDKLQTFIDEDVLYSCVDISRNEDTCLIVEVKPSNKITTVACNIYMRSDSSTVTVFRTDMATLIMKQTCVDAKYAVTLPVLDDVEFGQRLLMLENKNLEFKYYPSYELMMITLRNKKGSAIEKCLLAFPNVPGGGVMLIGIQEDNETGSLVMRGLALTVAQQSDFEIELESVFLRAPTGERRIWGCENHRPSQGREWYVTYVPVHNTPDVERRVIICIHVNQFRGGVFAKSPECYKAMRDGTLRELSFVEWSTAVLELRGEAKSAVPLETNRSRIVLNGTIHNGTVNKVMSCIENKRKRDQDKANKIISVGKSLNWEMVEAKSSGNVIRAHSLMSCELFLHQPDLYEILGNDSIAPKLFSRMILSMDEHISYDMCLRNAIEDTLMTEESSSNINMLHSRLFSDAITILTIPYSAGILQSTKSAHVFDIAEGTPVTGETHIERALIKILQGFEERPFGPMSVFDNIAIERLSSIFNPRFINTAKDFLILTTECRQDLVCFVNIMSSCDRLREIITFHDGRIQKMKTEVSTSPKKRYSEFYNRRYGKTKSRERIPNETDVGYMITNNQKQRLN